jgi:hypothetical protein
MVYGGAVENFENESVGIEMVEQWFINTVLSSGRAVK